MSMCGTRRWEVIPAIPCPKSETAPGIRLTGASKVAPDSTRGAFPIASGDGSGSLRAPAVGVYSLA
jgi:hypothetical protein